MNAATLYTLILVTQGANVTVTSGIQSLALCEDVRQIALTGRTVSEQKEAEAKRLEVIRNYGDQCKADPNAPQCRTGSVAVMSTMVTGLDMTTIKFSRCMIEPTR